ncbi:MAG: hypothetical protein KJ052_12135 [Candidatus Hydrogenedentes bacterium]|nr:hypothetical protein [Candidatus Hydrogenedentota bacterium]
MKNAITTIPFHGASLIVRQGETPETTLVAMKPLVEGMSLDWGGQHKKLSAHPVLSKGVSVLEIPSPGGMQLMTALPLNRIHFWLATIQPNRITDDAVREKVIIFQTEVADTLFEKFFGKAIAAKGAASGKQVAAILDDKLKALSRRIDHMILGVDARVAALEYVSVRELLEEAKAVQKGRRGLNRKVGHDLKVRALLAGHPSPCRRCPHSGVWLFQRDFAGSYMREIGKGLVHAHNAKQTGQTSLRLIGGKAA